MISTTPRTIKFRVWNANKNVWCETYANIDLIIDDLDQSDNGYFIQQFTGLFDKNGKEIYEGDIVQFPSGKALKVEFGEYSESEGMAFNWSHLGFHLFDKVIGQSHALPDCGELQIIGNIHENPELST